MRVRIHFSKGSLPLLFSYLLMILCLAGCAEDSNILDNGQNRQLEFSVLTHGWNDSNSNFSDSKSDSRATPINTFDTSKSFNVIADVNKEGNWSTEVKNETSSYSTTNKIWQTTATHYWPGAGSTINFYAYYPTSISGSITHNTGSAPVLSYTVPDNTTDQIDILASSKTGIAGDSYNQTPVDFKHVFAAIHFTVGSSGMPSGTITKVTLNNILYKGIYNLDGTWTPNTTDKKSFSQTVSASTNASTTITSGPTTFMMIPQTLSDASVTVTYSNGGTLTKAITGTWEAGKTYTYDLVTVRASTYMGSATIGDYLYADGTEGTIYKSGQTVGIIYSNELSAEQYNAGYTHGRVLALKNANNGDYCYWSSSTSTTTYSAEPYVTTFAGCYQDISSGYYGTCIRFPSLASNSSNYAWYYCRQYKDGITKTFTNSGWYLPSAGDWWDIVANLGNDLSSTLSSLQTSSISVGNYLLSGLSSSSYLQSLNSKLTNTDGTSFDYGVGAYCYLCSSECDGSIVIGLSFNTSSISINYASKTNNIGYIRTVLVY
ncbi:MAG: fimbrillin family protein [Prevotella sp.]|jgi:hypothetical protein|nr:fimbrillin family protein [Prevotella sp.]